MGVASKTRVKDIVKVHAKCKALSSAVIAAKKQFAEACKKGDVVDLRKFTKDSGFCIDTPLEHGFSGLQLACRAGNPNVVGNLLARKASPKFQRYDGINLIQAIASTDVEEKPEHLECLKLLLNSLQHYNSPPNVSVNEVRNNSYSALMFAALKGHVGMVEALLHAGANKEYKDKSGKTAFDVAVGAKNFKIAKILDPEAEILMHANVKTTANLNEKEEATEKPAVVEESQVRSNDNAEMVVSEDICRHVTSDVEELAKIEEAVIDAKDENSVVTYNSPKDVLETLGLNPQQFESPILEEHVCNEKLVSIDQIEKPEAFLKERETGRNRLHLVLKLEGLAEYCDRLDQLHVNYERFISFDEQDLKRIGVMDGSHRSRMVQLILKFRQQNEDCPALEHKRDRFPNSIRFVSGNPRMKNVAEEHRQQLSEQDKASKFVLSETSTLDAGESRTLVATRRSCVTDIFSPGILQGIPIYFLQMAALIAVTGCYLVREWGNSKFL